MIEKFNVTTIYVLDKDEALAFYVDKLGLEKGNDVKQGEYPNRFGAGRAGPMMS